MPIGFSLDADSELSLISFAKYINNSNKFSLKLSDADININNSSNNFWSDVSFNNKEIEIAYIKKINQFFNLKMKLIKKDLVLIYTKILMLLLKLNSFTKFVG